MIYGPQQLAQIHARMAGGDVAGARADVEAALAKESGNGQLWHLAGVIRRKSGDNAGARDALQTAISLGSASAELYNTLALVHEDLADLDAAEQAYADAGTLDSAYLPAQVNAAKLLFARDRISAAIGRLENVSRKHPDADLVINALAEMYHKTGDLDRAEALYTGLIGRNPGNMAATIRMGQLLRDKGKPEAALEHLTRHAPNFPAVPEYGEALSGPLVDLRRFTEARQLLEQIVAAAPAYFPAHRALARLAKEYTSDEDCYASFRALSRQWPREVSIWKAWAITASAFRDYALALDVIAEAKNHFTLPPELVFLEAVALGETNQPQLAEQRFSALSAASIPARDYCAARARNAVQLRDGEGAAHWANKAVEHSPDDQFAWAYLGLAWRLLGDEREHWLFDYARQTAQIPVPMLESREMLDRLCDVLRKLHIASNNAAEQSMRHGTQTQGALFHLQDSSIQELRQDIAQVVDNFVVGLPDDATHPFYRRKSGKTRFVGSWSVRLRQAGFHISHIHQEGWISSALHLVVPDLNAEVGLDSPGCLLLGSPPAELNLELGPRKIVRPVEGSLVLFPSMMWHGTSPFSQDSERLTVAFDAVPA